MAILSKTRWSLVLCIFVAGLFIVAAPAAAKHRRHWRRPAYGRQFRVLPPGFRMLHHRRHDYYYWSGIFYRRYDDFYRVVRPPFGLIVNTLPLGYIDVRIGDRIYARYNDIYYQPCARGYMVVEPPPSAPPPPQPDVTATPANALGKVRVKVEVLNVRSGPGRLYPVTDHVSAGDKLVVLAVAPRWYYVRLPEGGYGWVWAQFVRGQVTSPARVTG